MADYLDRLVARAHGAADVLAPPPRTVFEQTPTDPWPPPAAADPTPDGGDDVRPVGAPVHPATEPARAVTGPAPAPAGSGPAAAPSAVSPAAARSVAPESGPGRTPGPTGSRPGRGWWDAPDETATPMPQRPARRAAGAASESPDRPPVLRPAGPDPVVRSDAGAVVRPAAAAGSQAPAAERAPGRPEGPRAVVAPEPVTTSVVQVRIGRVEVRAATPEPVRTVPRAAEAPAPAPGPTLDSYLDRVRARRG